MSLAVSAFGWGVAWSSFQTRVDGLEARIVKLETANDRLTRMERLLASVVCAQGTDPALCREAMANIGGTR